MGIAVIRVQELRESRGGRPGLPVSNKLDGFCGREAALKRNEWLITTRRVEGAASDHGE